MPLFAITESEIPGGRNLADKSRDKTGRRGRPMKRGPTFQMPAL